MVTNFSPTLEVMGLESELTMGWECWCLLTEYDELDFKLKSNRSLYQSLHIIHLYKVAWLNWKQKDDGLIQEYNTTSSQQYVHNIIVPSAQDQEVQHNEAPTPQSIELDELDRQFYEMTKNIQEFGSELKSVNPKLVESSTPS